MKRFFLLVLFWAVAPGSITAQEEPPTRGQIQDRTGKPLAFTEKGERRYPLGETAAHITGYASLKDSPTVTGGRAGLEQALDATLAKGTDVRLTVDSDLQSAVFKALSNKVKSGAAVVLDVTNGEILALVSVPSFDPNLFHPILPKEDFKRILANPGAPLLNRIAHAEYPPGSTFKVITSLAALRNHHEGNYRCDARMQIDGKTFHCWNRKGHGNIGLQDALKTSCNCYFYQAALDIKGPALHQTARAFGLGIQTGIQFPHEKSGSLGKPERWKGPALANAAIGQGDIMVTPLQMASVTAAIANGGIIKNPRIVLKPAKENGDEKRAAGIGAGYVPATPLRTAIVAAAIANGEIVKDPRAVLNTGRENEGEKDENAAPKKPVERLAEIGINEEMLEVVRRGMRSAVMDRVGTASAANSKNLDIAAKTGTAQWKQRARLAWCIGFAPYKAPKYAVVVVVEGDEDEGITGGKTACPLLGEIMHAVNR